MIALSMTLLCRLLTIQESRTPSTAANFKCLVWRKTGTWR